MGEIKVERPKKRVLIALLLCSTLFLDIVLFGIWRIGYLGLMELSPLLPQAVGAVFAAGAAFMLLSILNMAASVKGCFSVPLFSKQQYGVINLLFPMAVRIGSLFGVSRRRLEGMFIAISNILFVRRHIQVPAERLLVVTPHCLQLASCPHKITRDANNCKRCGGCNIGDLMKLSDEMGFYLFVATGGTLARQIIKEKRPKAVLAIACERDLMSGIQDVYPLPAVGVLNIRPNGPCYNTKVDMDEVRNELKKIVLPKDEV